MPRTSPPDFWNRVARRYAERQMGNPEAYEAAMARVIAHLAPTDRMLELGCGTGSTALKLAPHVGQIIASDYAGEMCAIAGERIDQARATNVTPLQASVDEALSHGPVDVVCAFNLLHLLPDLPGTLAQIHSALPEGGRFISKTVCLGGSLKYRAIVTALQWAGVVPQMRFVTAEGLEAEITGAGFAIIETGTYPAAPPGRLIVAEKR
ncbi:class I SAM-dependent methyltransferase [Maritalea mobilis]|uniref:class I SAM-dependent methyltransferase n=1 Tax=Maritalea mobilis TaxID=483324 RepID=UPI001C944A9B|nr:class I SAM-dependent methyltransferase [Maritalea mobilis]MBY6200683.1 class I SAM-dependent methyltransferase [Maritalea mobilis]